MRAIPYLAVLALAVMLDFSVVGGEMSHATIRAAKNSGAQFTSTVKRLVGRQSSKEIAKANVVD